MSLTAQPFITEDVHGYFGLSYASYLVMPRTLLQSMPPAWQHRFIALVEEFDAAVADVDRADVYKVQPAIEKEAWELADFELRAAAITRMPNPDYDENDPAGPEQPYFYYDGHGQSIEASDEVLVPVAIDPLPHYQRGRTRVPLDLEAIDALHARRAEATRPDDTVLPAAVTTESLDALAVAVPHLGAGALQISPDRRSGRVLLGTSADGSAGPDWNLWTVAGARCGVIVGDDSSGTQTVLTGLLKATAATDLVERWVLDAVGASASPPVPWSYHGAARLLDGLRHANDRLDDRQRRAQDKAQTSYRPTPDEPLLLIAVTGLQHLAGTGAAREAGELLYRLFRTGRKFGVAPLLVADDLLVRNFAGLVQLRDAALAGNTVVLRTTSSPTRHLLPHLPGDPAQLPEWPGTGYVLGHHCTFRAFGTPTESGEES